jgi:TRAP-type mannitol/chloroaromatic compound transport system permease large subunit
MELFVLVGCFLLLLVMGFPIAFNMILSSSMYLLVGGYPQLLVVQRMFEGMNGFSLLSVPFFVLTGQFLLKGHLLEALIDFVNAFIGHVGGALALVTVGTCLFMGAIVGLALASVASLGSFYDALRYRAYYRTHFRRKRPGARKFLLEAMRS